MTSEKFVPHVRFPRLRHELLWYLYELANEDHQRIQWAHKQAKSAGSMQGFDFVVHFFFDDTQLGAQPQNTLGDILTDDIEVASVRHVAEELEKVLSALPRDAADIEYLNLPAWRGVVSASQAAYRILRPRLIEEGDDAVPPVIEGHG